MMNLKNNWKHLDICDVDDKSIRVLFLSHMFPNNIFPLDAIFIADKAIAMSSIADLTIVAPVSYFPLLKNKLPEKNETFENLIVFHPRYLALPTILFCWRWLTYYCQVGTCIRKFLSRCDLINIEWIYPDAYAASRYAKKYNIKLVGVVHGNEAIEYFGEKSHRKKYIKAFGYLDKIIVVSNDLKRKIVNEYHVNENKISVILNGVDLKKFPKIDQKKAKFELGLTADKKIGVCVARLSEEKNLDILIEAASVIANDELNIYIIGDGPLKNKLGALIIRLELKDMVKLVGPVLHDEIYWWLNAADFFCLPSQREGCPVVIHEALACGVPVISTTVGAIPDLIKDDRFGLLCEPDSVSAFTAIMKKAMLKTWDREIISAYGRQFTWDKVAKQTVEVFKSVLEDNF